MVKFRMTKHGLEYSRAIEEDHSELFHKVVKPEGQIASTSEPPASQVFDENWIISGGHIVRATNVS